MIFIYIFFRHGWKEMLSGFFLERLMLHRHHAPAATLLKPCPLFWICISEEVRRPFFSDLKQQQRYFKKCLTESPAPRPKKTITKLNKTKRLHIIFAENTNKKHPGARHSPKCRRHCVFSEAAEIISSFMVLYGHRNHMVYQGREKNGIGNESSVTQLLSAD